MVDVYKNLLVALDGSSQSEQALLEGIEVAKRNESVVYLTWIINDAELTTSAYAFSKLLQDEEAYVKDFLIKKVSQVRAAGVKKVEMIIDMGSPKRKLATELPEKYAIDLIVIGSTGKGALTQALVGSTTAFVVNHAPCNVLVVK